MEDPKSPDEDDNFLDASDEFPFYDCPNSFDPSSSCSTFSLSSPSNTNFYASNLRRRRSHRKSHRDSRDREKLAEKSTLTTLESTSENATVSTVNAEIKENLTVTLGNKSPDDSPTERGNDEGQLSLLVFLAEFIVKAIMFQINLLISFITFPFWTLFYGFMLVINPFYVIGLGRSYLFRKLMRLWRLVSDALTPYVSEWFKEHKYVLNLVLRYGWGLFWSLYVCSILVSLLILAFVIGGVMMRFYVVQEPFQLKQALNFDYTKTRPEAFVPIISCEAVECGEKYEGVSVGSGLRVIPLNHKLQATVSLALPESDYNQNLGMFQVRVDFVSEKGKSLASLSHPCMLEFKSKPLRLLLTFFKIIPLVAGYVSESQTLNLKFRGYTESALPTACLKVILEQRAEFRPGAGIPEVYNAFLHLESELPFFKRILWYWRKTIFVWVSMTLFVVELLFALVCCRSAIMPRTRARGNAA
ncbi:hypothetical protein BVRB_3g055320 [Beta vulgaris subsp. vulgaris]|nr:hypothetical protein BVRB_3g055320 [Beta vulgaris subsp. vulgaris]